MLRDGLYGTVRDPQVSNLLAQIGRAVIHVVEAYTDRAKQARYDAHPEQGDQGHDALHASEYPDILEYAVVLRILSRVFILFLLHVKILIRVTKIV